MSFLLDPPALVIIGLVAGKAYYLSTVFGDRLFRRGSLRRGLLVTGAVVVGVFWTYSAALYLSLIYFPWPLPRLYGGTDWMLNSGFPLGLARSTTTDAAAVVVFATYPLWFYLGTELGLAGHRVARSQRLRERDEIINQLVCTIFPPGGAIPPGAAEVDTGALVKSLMAKIPPLFRDSLTLLLFVIDSRFMVLAFTGRWTRFVNLDGDTGSTFEKRKYLEVWQSNPFLASIAQVLRVTAAYGYYTRPQVYRPIRYSGPMIPELPAWYVPGTSPAAARESGQR